MKKIVVVALILISSFCSTSCTKTESGNTSKQLNVAYINTDNLLKKWEKYRDLGDKYIKDRDKYIKDRNDLASKVKRLRSDMEGNISEINDSQKKELAELQSQHLTLTTELQSLNAEWSKKRTDIVNELRDIASEVAKEQKIDVVIDNSESSPVIEYGGEDITVDILSKLREKEDKKNKK